MSGACPCQQAYSSPHAASRFARRPRTSDLFNHATSCSTTLLRAWSTQQHWPFACEVDCDQKIEPRPGSSKEIELPTLGAGFDL